MYFVGLFLVSFPLTLAVYDSSYQINPLGISCVSWPDNSYAVTIDASKPSTPNIRESLLRIKDGQGNSLYDGSTLESFPTLLTLSNGNLAILTNSFGATDGYPTIQAKIIQKNGTVTRDTFDVYHGGYNAFTASAHTSGGFIVAWTGPDRKSFNVSRYENDGNILDSQSKTFPSPLVQIDVAAAVQGRYLVSWLERGSNTTDTVLTGAVTGVSDVNLDKSKLVIYRAKYDTGITTHGQIYTCTTQTNGDGVCIYSAFKFTSLNPPISTVDTTIQTFTVDGTLTESVPYTTKSQPTRVFTFTNGTYGLFSNSDKVLHFFTDQRVLNSTLTLATDGFCILSNSTILTISPANENRGWDTQIFTSP
ncbi:hypothetical protein K7432_016634 [Basidiobolus ranarum]|uniref:Uncharacterized protein n=1 Tax=Basidiobolus ranarum TaxID=34480 RepID=A0ABR2WEF2_9FUNG